MTALLLPLVAACLAAAVAGTPLVLVDNAQHAYLQAGPKAYMEKSSASALMAAVTGLMPGSGIGEDLSRELSTILKPSPFAKPKAFVILNVAGLTADMTGELFSHREHRTVELTGDGCPAMSVVNGLARLSSANPTVQLTVADQTGAQECEGDCLEQNLAGAAEDFELDLSALDLKQQDAKLLAVEIGSVYAGLKSKLEKVRQGSAADVELYEVSIMGLRALTSNSGADSDAVVAARNAVLRLLKWAVDSLDSVYQGDTVYQVLLLEKGPARVDSLKQVANWKDQTRRQLLQAVYPPTDPTEETAQAKLFSAKAAGYGAFVLLVYFSVAAVWCMCYMPFKQDTLLYGSKKEQ